ncbi:PucR family transcriptional regulator [Bacillus massiliglaciei]|uniref:PucR family transcriptional regulator n=1 Tax=Bacillus massiliglaciei TaxID=1816693 RepID=UPI000A4CA871|nr:PucR family transcriptional regulator [Bacillus massiliglaciei]
MNTAALLQLTALDGTKVIAGESGLINKIESANMMDAPDIADYLKPNEFLVTTAYHFKDHPESMAELVISMAEQGCAALGIKTKRFLQEIPEQVIRIANEQALPIIEIPSHLSLGEIVNLTLKAILDQRAGELTQALEIHKQFTQIIMKGNRLDKLIENLSSMISLPAVLLNQYFKPIARSAAGFSLEQLSTAVEMNKSSFINPLPSFSIKGGSCTFTVFPAHIGELKTCYLIIMGEVKEEERLSKLIIEQASNVISFALMKEYAVTQYEQNIKNDFFQHFLDGAFSTEGETLNRAAEFGLSPDSKYICAVGKMDGEGFEGSYALSQQKADTLFGYMAESFTFSEFPVHFFNKRPFCIALFEYRGDPSNALQAAEGALIQIQSKINKQFHSGISFGMSSLCHGFLHVKNAYKEASEAFQNGFLLGKKPFIQVYKTKDLTELLRLIPAEDLQNFYTHALKDFSFSNSEEEQSLHSTLSVYLETHGQVSETAKRLYVHRNTVVYRLEKCEEMLGRSLKDPEVTLQLRIAFRIKSLLNL